MEFTNVSSIPPGQSLENKNARSVKRTFDLIFSTLGIVIFLPFISFLWLCSSIDTRRNGFFTQLRIGQYGIPFRIIKIRTMSGSICNSTVTISGDVRITPFGSLMRKYKLDELPQLFNIFIGEMSFVGPRPDVPGYADRLVGKERKLLIVKPGITGLATLKYHDEETLLSLQLDPEGYANKVVWPDKVQMNLFYISNWSLKLDFQIMISTLFC